jgi:c-di-GMP-binding flagellar brake protein YcgR
VGTLFIVAEFEKLWLNECVIAQLSASILRFQFDAPVRVQGKAIGKKPTTGRICEISACGLSAVSAGNIEVDEVVDLQFVLNGLKVQVRAAVRNRDDARCGFEFLTLSGKQRQQIESATRTLAACPQED